ncbi:MAG: glycyl-radical enzyme activating protein [Clostridia bacterium]|nr:glycyl-radical enzyme activating protein [Clostridia bacterium]
MQGTIFNIQKFCINDGPGIRTTVFLKGCPLRCVWCHNPESQRVAPELMFDPQKCIGCGKCFAVCPKEAHSMTETAHVLDREKCVACGACAINCYAESLEMAGKTATVDEILEEVMKDEAFYQNSGGGMTLSGGEPLAQPEFSVALLKGAKEKGLHTAVETCGFSAKEIFKSLAEYTDLFLFDWKITNDSLHKEYTGVSNVKILENLELANQMGKQIVLRCPIIPSVNDTKEHFAGIADLANRLEHVIGIDVEPYHPLGTGKNERLGKEAKAFEMPEPDTVNGWISDIQKLTAKPVKKG